LDRPTKIIELPKAINEISGLAFANNGVFAVDDNHGALFFIPLQENPKIRKWDFGKDEDYEGLVLYQNHFYLLQSKGAIVWFSNQFPIRDIKREKLDRKGKSEYESLYLDPRTKKLIMLCKDCDYDKKKENTAWSFDLQKMKFDDKQAFTISASDIEKAMKGKYSERFKPSAAAIHPITGDTYIISSINGILVIASKDKIRKVMKLDQKLFKQPEGLCFMPDGTLLISNESAGKGPANILIFKADR